MRSTFRVRKNRIHIFLIFLTIISLLIVAYIAVNHYKISEEMLINKHRMVVVENGDIVDHTTIETHPIHDSIVDAEKLNQLKQYMMENDLVIKAGTYEIHDADSFKQLLKRFDFEKVR